MFSKILLAVDGSAHSARAAEKAGELAQLAGSQVLVFHVREMLPARGVYDMDATEGDVDIAADIADELKAKGVEVSSHREREFYGYTPRIIVEAAKQFGADVIVMGTRGRSDLPGLLLGSVTHKVLHLSEVPVLVIR